VRVNEPVPPPQKPAAGHLGGTYVVLSALAVAAPVATAGTGLPLVFVGLGLLLLACATGLTALSRRTPQAGPLYSFVARGLGRPLGLGVAALALVSYQALQFGFYGAIGVAAEWFGVAAPWWVIALGAWAVVTVCGILRAAVTVGLIAVLVVAEIAAIVGYRVADVFDPAGERLAWSGVLPADLSRAALGLLLVGAALAFVGFETTLVPGGPRRAIFVTVALLAILYAAASLVPLDLTAVALGRAMVVAGLLAALIALHRVLVAYLIALGRDGVLPPALARTSRRTSVPVVASLAQSAVALAVLGGCASAGWDIGAGVVVAGEFGVLMVLLATSLAALLFLNRRPNGEGAWTRLLAPSVATVGLGVLGYLGVRDLAEGVWLIAAAAAVLLGIGYGLVLRRAAPVRYAGIGLGGAAVVVSPGPPMIPKQRLPGAHRPERIDREPIG
jgi:amino acid transporter